jgi:hypothetical protein
MPDKIAIYRGPLERLYAHGPESLRREVRDERVEHQRRKPGPLVFIRIEVDAQGVIVEGSRDDRRGRVDRVQLKRMNVHVPLRRH